MLREICERAQQLRTVRDGLTHSNDSAATHLESSLPYSVEGVQAILIGSRRDDLASCEGRINLIAREKISGDATCPSNCWKLASKRWATSRAALS